MPRCYDFLTLLIRRALLKFCLHSLPNNRFTSTTKSFNTEEDFAIRYNSPTKIPYACLFGIHAFCFIRVVFIRIAG